LKTDDIAPNEEEVTLEAAVAALTAATWEADSFLVSFVTGEVLHVRRYSSPVNNAVSALYRNPKGVSTGGGRLGHPKLICDDRIVQAARIHLKVIGFIIILSSKYFYQEA
jgi:hypothetical protein